MSRLLLHPGTLAACFAALLMALMAVFPEPVLRSSLRGLSIWWEVLFPALFPFFVISELMLGIGIVHFMGKLLDPFMRPIFRIPGSGGFVLAMGYLSGYPVGARLTSQLWDQKLISQIEGERLVAITTTSDPIFLIGAVSVGFFHQPAIAPVLAAAHYGGSLVVGFLMRFHGLKEETGASSRFPVPDSLSLQSRMIGSSRPATATSERGLRAALKAMHEARLADGRTLGVLLGHSISSGLRLMFVVGGLVVVFSVIMELLQQTALLGALEGSLATLLQWSGLNGSLSSPLVKGLFEVTLGAKSATEAGIPLIHQTAAAAWVLSWAGLSVHAQISSLLSNTNLRYRPFFLARLAHSFLAAALVYLLWTWIGPA